MIWDRGRTGGSGHALASSRPPRVCLQHQSERALRLRDAPLRLRLRLLRRSQRRREAALQPLGRPGRQRRVQASLGRREGGPSALHVLTRGPQVRPRVLHARIIVGRRSLDDGRSRLCCAVGGRGEGRRGGRYEGGEPATTKSSRGI